MGFLYLEVPAKSAFLFTFTMCRFVQHSRSARPKGVPTSAVERSDVIMSTPLILYFNEEFLRKSISSYYKSIDKNPNTKLLVEEKAILTARSLGTRPQLCRDAAHVAALPTPRRERLCDRLRPITLMKSCRLTGIVHTQVIERRPMSGRTSRAPP